MILKQFNLDIPYVQDEIFIQKIVDEAQFDRYEASHKDYELHWKEKRVMFADQVRCICAYFERYFQKYKFKTNGIWKVIIECYEDINKVDRYVIRSDVYVIRIQFDVDKFFLLNNEEKKTMIFKAFIDGLYKVVELEKWDKSIFEKIINEMKANDLRNHYILNSKRSPDHRYQADLICNHDIDFFDASIVIKDREKIEIIRKKIIVDRPNEWSFVKHFGKFYWKSSNEVALMNKDGSNEILVRF